MRFLFYYFDATRRRGGGGGDDVTSCPYAVLLKHTPHPATRDDHYT